MYERRISQTRGRRRRCPGIGQQVMIDKFSANLYGALSAQPWTSTSLYVSGFRKLNDSAFSRITYENNVQGGWTQRVWAADAGKCSLRMAGRNCSIACGGFFRLLRARAASRGNWLEGLARRSVSSGSTGRVWRMYLQPEPLLSAHSTGRRAEMRRKIFTHQPINRGVQCNLPQRRLSKNSTNTARCWSIAGPSFLLPRAFCLAAFATGVHFIPDAYEATTTLSWRSRRLPEKYVATTVPEDPSDRLNLLQQETCRPPAPY